MQANNQLIEVSNPGLSNLSEQTLEKVMINQDLAPLSVIEKFEYLKNLSLSLGLNPLTKPFEIIKFQGKEVPYARKDATEQLRKLNHVSVRAMETKMIADDIYIVTAFARTPDGREDSSTGVVSIKGLRGDMLCNAMMKAETKAKRRVTLSICGLGFLDESELDTLPNPQPVHLSPVNDTKSLSGFKDEQLEIYIKSIESAKDFDELQEVYTVAYKHYVSEKNKFNLSKIVSAKDKRKQEIEVEDFKHDMETGEIHEQHQAV